MMKKAFNWLRKQEKEQLDGTWTEVAHEDADAEDAPLNRRQRRMYIRLVQVSEHPTPEQRRERRQVRMHLVGFGRWRRHRYLSRAGEAGRLGQP